jgi:hypothetical protein
MTPGQSNRHLSRTQIEVLASIADGSNEYVGFDGNERRTCGSLVRRGLAYRTPSGELPLYAITPTGRERLERCR